jgi:HK97 family phage prohead protease
MTVTAREAAELRALHHRSLGDRPAQRGAGPAEYDRWRQRTGPAPAAVVRGAVVACRAAGDSPDDGQYFSGFASVSGAFYRMYDMFGPYDEQVAVGAGEQTLAQDDLQVPLVLDHVSSRRIAMTGNLFSPLNLTEVTEGDRTGLLAEAPSLRMDDPDVAYIVPKMRSGLINEMSFRFSIDEGRWSEDFTQYTIMRYDIQRGDVSIVGFGANPFTAGAGVREAPVRASRGGLARLGLTQDGDDRYRNLKV